jgi:hypothetical protein
MQYLIGFGLVFLGIIAGFFLCSLSAFGKAEDMAKEHLNEILEGLKKGEIQIEDLERIK